MNLSLLFDLILGFGMSFFTAQGETYKVGVLRKLQKAKASGANVDAFMQQVAQDLLGDVPLAWEELDANIDAAADEFLSRGSGGEPE